MESLSEELVQQLCIDASACGVDAHTCLVNLEKIMKNAIANPGNAKFRRLRTTNPALIRTVLAVPQAELLLTSFGFLEQTDADGETFLVLPDGVVGDAQVADIVARGAATTKPADAPISTITPSAQVAPTAEAMERAQMLAEAKARHAAEEKERLRQRQLIAEDKASRALRAESQVVGASHLVPRSTAAGAGLANTFKDVGVDVNAAGGG